MAQSFSSDPTKPTVTSPTSETYTADERQPDSEPADLLIEELSEHTLQLMWTLRQEAMRAFEPLGMRPMKALLLELVGRGLVYPKELSDMLDTLPPAISAIVADLEERGLLRRGLDPNDKRKIRLELTPDGQTMRRFVFASPKIMAPSSSCLRMRLGCSKASSTRWRAATGLR